MKPTVLMCLTRFSTLAMGGDQLRQAFVADPQGTFWPEHNPLVGLSPMATRANRWWKSALAWTVEPPTRFEIPVLWWEGKRAERLRPLRRFASLTMGEARFVLVMSDGSERTFTIRDGHLYRVREKPYAPARTTRDERALAVENRKLRAELRRIPILREIPNGEIEWRQRGVPGEATHVLVITKAAGEQIVRRIAFKPGTWMETAARRVLEEVGRYVKGHRETVDLRLYFAPLDPAAWDLAISREAGEVDVAMVETLIADNARLRGLLEQKEVAEVLTGAALSPAAVAEMGTAPTLPPEAPKSAPSAPATAAVSSQGGLPPVLAPACVGGQQTVRSDLYPTSSSRQTAPGGEPEGFHLMLLDFEDEAPPVPTKPASAVAASPAPVVPATPATPATPPAAPVSASVAVLRATLRDPKAAHTTKTRTACLLALHDEEMSRGAIVREVRQLYPDATVEQVHGALAALVQDGSLREQGGVYEIRTRG